MEERLKVGIISATHGVHGEVKVFPTTDDVNRFKQLKEVILDAGGQDRILEIEGVKFFKKFVILKFKGYDDINGIEKYRGKDLYVPREQAVKCQKDEYFIADLLGMEVVLEDGARLGVLQDVIETGANDVYRVRMDSGGEVLIPAIRQCILKVDVEAGFMQVHLLDGLL